MSKKDNRLVALEQLLEFSSPQQLRVSIESMFHAYLMDVDRAMPIDYKQVVEDRYILLEFLKKIEQ